MMMIPLAVVLAVRLAPIRDASVPVVGRRAPLRRGGQQQHEERRGTALRQRIQFYFNS